SHRPQRSQSASRQRQDRAVLMWCPNLIRPRSGEFNLETSRPATRIFVVSTLKSGSSFVVMLLQNATGFGHLRPALVCERMLKDVPSRPIIEATTEPSVSQLHCHAKQRTLELCGQLSIKPIFMTRNVFDSLLSMKEYIDNVPHQHLFPHYYRLTTEQDKMAF